MRVDMHENRNIYLKDLNGSENRSYETNFSKTHK